MGWDGMGWAGRTGMCWLVCARVGWLGRADWYVLAVSARVGWMGWRVLRQHLDGQVELAVAADLCSAPTASL